ncbi:MAG TPA: VWA domain-containing protein [Thermomicrobiales bacterium]|nr:VWA domain-containing protein [Thermomicrobiales bacterium]
MDAYQHNAHYSRWDGSQQISSLTADEIMRAIADELVDDGDLMRALRQLFREGLETADGERLPGWYDMLQKVRQAKQEQLNRFDMGSIIDDIRARIRDVVETERDGLEQRLEAAEATLAAAEARSDSGQEAQPDAPTLEEEPRLTEMLRQMVRCKQEQLAELPADPAGAVRSLQEYDFVNPGAREKFQELLKMLQDQVMNQAFQGMQQSMSDMTPEDIAESRQMMSELNDMIEAHNRGEPTNFDQFMHRWGHYFGPDITSIEDLIAHMQQQMQAMNQLLQSMSPEQRSQLQQMMEAVTSDPGLQEEMARLASNIGQLMPQPGNERAGYQFGGEESISLDQAVRLMDRMNDYDDLERALKDVRDWDDFARLDEDKIRDLLGEETQEQMQQLSQIAQMLEDAGFVRKNRRGFELTPQGVRKIGEKALSDIFKELKKDKVGQHELHHGGGPGERIDESKPYEFGDPFLLDLPRTVMNAVRRDGIGDSVRLRPDDFEIYKTEYITRSATVLMIDMSRSMFYNQYFPAAKRIALAMDSLIRSKYPRDSLQVIGFSYIAQPLKAADLPGLTWNEYEVGTNLQHGFRLAQQMLAREHASNKQIIVITDGEPTAHIEPNGEVFFSWPPTPQTWDATLKEVIRCTRDGIRINTFMLERSAYLMKFVNDLSRINGGRVFYASPDHLGEYVLVDYVANKRKWLQ